jgi:hypothetical protein
VEAAIRAHLPARPGGGGYEREELRRLNAGLPAGTRFDPYAGAPAPEAAGPR